MITPRNLITQDDIKAVISFLELGSPLSGYLAGNPWGGAAVQRLEEMWCTKFNRKHAICCNSATSGLLAACVAMGIERNIHVGVPALSMSATAAAPKFLGADLKFLDCDDSGGISYDEDEKRLSDIIIATTLWGHPIDLRWTAQLPLILDNAQGILSGYTDGSWSENIADICVTSFNVHKQINAGEMGIISTGDVTLAATMRAFINHGENHVSDTRVGLNLRPTEISAILALSQMSRIDQTIYDLNWLSKAIDDNMPLSFKPIHPRDGTTSARYCYAFQVDPDKRDQIVGLLNNEGVPCSVMYKPLYHLPAFRVMQFGCETAEHISQSTIIFELCAWRYEDDLTGVSYALKKAAKL